MALDLIIIKILSLAYYNTPFVLFPLVPPKKVEFIVIALSLLNCYLVFQLV